MTTILRICGGLCLALSILVLAFPTPDAIWGAALLLSIVSGALLFIVADLRERIVKLERGQGIIKIECDKNLPQRNCSHCGREYDFDFPSCPFCGQETVESPSEE